MSLPTATPPAAPSRRRRILVAVLVVWALVLAGLAYWSFRHDAPTVREQRTLAQARPVVARTVGDLVAAAGPDAVPVISGASVASGCRITPLRRGSTLTVGLRFYTGAEDGAALLKRIADGLPAGYAARASDTAVRIDAGSFVAVRGRLTAPGVVHVNVTTGCRPGSLPPGTALPASARFDEVPVRVLSTLGATSVDPVTTLAAPCPGGGAVTTAQATGRATPPPLSTALGATPVLATPQVYAYRDGGYAYAVTVDGDSVAVFATSGC